jgi:aquaporin Z
MLERVSEARVTGAYPRADTMLPVSWMRKAFTELVGTFFFLSVIALSGKAGAFTPLAIGFALTAMVYMGGHVSGAHYNPSVSF